MKKIPIPIPPIDKQHRIVGELEDLQTLVSLENEIKETLEQYKESYIYELVTGKREV
jgi:restriction endonuclease S subunit